MAARRSASEREVAVVIYRYEGLDGGDLLGLVALVEVDDDVALVDLEAVASLH